MADRKPIFLLQGQPREMGAGDSVAIANGGTGATSADTARAALGFGSLLEQWVASAPTPTSTGVKGQLYHDGNYLFVCVAANTWVRHAVERSW